MFIGGAITELRFFASTLPAAHVPPSKTFANGNCSGVGIKALLEAHPDVSIYTVCCQDNVTDEGYLSPGIGDIGSRYYNTQ